MSAPVFPPSSAGRAFTLWLDPARWPVVPLRLPGKAFTVWLDPARWPVPALRLPGRAFTLWQDPARWPVLRLRLPGEGFTLWLAPETWPLPSGLSLPVLLPPPDMPIQINQNKAFTLWTRPSQVTPIPMKNGMTAAGLAEATGAQPIRTAPSVAAAAGQPGNTVISPATATPQAHRFLPLAAGVVAVLGLNALINAADSKKLGVMDAGLDAELSGMRLRIEQAGKGMAEIDERNAKAADEFKKKVEQLEASALILQQENARMGSALTKAQETIRQAEAGGLERDGLIQKLQEELNQAKLVASTADTKAETLVVSAMEEASLIKRESAAAVVTLRESFARLEAEKAAALKAAAEAATALAKLQAQIQAAAKPAAP